MKITWGYLAGFTDGEGYIGICGRGPRFTWGQNHKGILDKIQAFLESHGYFCYAHVIPAKLPRRPNPGYMLNVNRRADCARLIRKLRPLMTVKVASCDRVMAWLRDNPAKNHMGSLNDSNGIIRRMAAEGYALGTIANKVKCGRAKLTAFCAARRIAIAIGGVHRNGKKIVMKPGGKP